MTRPITALLLLLACGAPAAAQTVTLAWNPSPDGWTAQYDVYVDGVARGRTADLQMANIPVVVGQTYRFEVASVDALGVVGPKSAPLFYTVTASSCETQPITIAVRAWPTWVSGRRTSASWTVTAPTGVTWEVTWGPTRVVVTDSRGCRVQAVR